MKNKNIKLPKHAAQILAAFSLGNAESDLLIWKIDLDGCIRFYVQCSDFFAYASADAEEIEENDIELLYQCLTDLKNLDDDYSEVYLAELFAARKRNKKPLQAWLDREHLKDNDLFTSLGEKSRAKTDSGSDRS